MKNIMKFGGTPAMRLKTGLPCASMSLAKMPMAADVPPTQGPNSAANIAGITAAGQNATPMKVRPKSVRRPMTA